jgi:transposase-like protein
MGAAKRFFSLTLAVVGHAPEKVTTDGHDAYPRAIRETLGSQVRHRTSRYMNNRQQLNETVSLSEQRRLFRERWRALWVVLRAG